MLSAFKAQRDAIDLDALTQAIEERNDRKAEAVLAAGLGVFSSSLKGPMSDLMLDTLNASGSSIARQVNADDSFRSANLGFSFNTANPEALRWAQMQSSSLVTGITSDTRLALREIMARSYSEGFTPREAARMMRGTVGLGLTGPQSNAVYNLRRRILDSPGKTIKAGRTKIRVPKGGMKPEVMQKRLDEYAKRQLNYRARVIAHNEAITASNQGQLSLWKQGIKEGYLSGNEVREWIVTPDDQLCPICAAMGGQRVTINETFAVDERGGVVDTPPAHIGCRCGMALISAGQKTITQGPSLPDAKPLPTPPSVPTKPVLDPIAKPGKECVSQFVGDDIPEKFYPAFDQEIRLLQENFPRLRNALQFDRVDLFNSELIPRYISNHDRAVGLCWRREKRMAFSLGRNIRSGSWGRKHVRIGEYITENGLRGTIRHEVGHYAQFNLINGGPSKSMFEWWDLAKVELKKGVKTRVSGYAATNEAELFAESFAAWTHPEYRMGMLPKRIENYFKREFPRLTEAPALEKVEGQVFTHSLVNYQANAKRIEKTLTAEERTWLGDYAKKDWSKVNSALRSRKGIEVGSTAEQEMKILDGIIQKTKLGKEVTVYRGGWTDRLIRPGQYLEDKAFLQTTLNEQVGRKLQGTGRLWRIKCPPGTNFVVHNGSPAANMEMILPRGARLRVVAVSKDAIDLELVL